MRTSVRLLSALMVGACTSQSPTGYNRLPPPSLQVTGTSHVVSSAGVPSLEVLASLRNPTTTRIQVAVGTECPLFVTLFPDPTGQQQGSVDASMACAPGGSTLDLAPGDSAVLTRILPGDSLTGFTPGTYGVNVAVTTSTRVIGTWAGAVQLPLALAP